MRKGKILTAENWNAMDERSSFIEFQNRFDGSEYCLTGSGWAERLLRYPLKASVPDEIVELQEVAIAVMCYGFNFYPLYTLGQEQITRVLEAAISHAYRALKGPSKKTRYVDRLDWVAAKLKFSDDRLKQWHASRAIRNSASHATKQSLFGSSDALNFVRISSILINELFEQIDSLPD
ncbi:MAG: hypothetical protein GYB19_13915 [Rhodospirillales bacterium]|nr:hypothetical protein [Rhodospirillales bacterium]